MPHNKADNEPLPQFLGHPLLFKSISFYTAVNGSLGLIHLNNAKRANQANPAQTYLPLTSQHSRSQVGKQHIIQPAALCVQQPWHPSWPETVCRQVCV